VLAPDKPSGYDPCWGVEAQMYKSLPPVELWRNATIKSSMTYTIYDPIV
jgi:hypothetical protein